MEILHTAKCSRVYANSLYNTFGIWSKEGEIHTHTHTHTHSNFNQNDHEQSFTTQRVTIICNVCKNPMTSDKNVWQHLKISQQKNIYIHTIRCSTKQKSEQQQLKLCKALIQNYKNWNNEIHCKIIRFSNWIQSCYKHPKQAMVSSINRYFDSMQLLKSTNFPHIHQNSTICYGEEISLLCLYSQSQYADYQNHIKHTKNIVQGYGMWTKNITFITTVWFKNSLSVICRL